MWTSSPDDARNVNVGERGNIEFKEYHDNSCKNLILWKIIINERTLKNKTAVCYCAKRLRLTNGHLGVN